MVVLNRIYTRSGDDGTTALGTGERRKKYDPRVCAYGTLDELATARAFTLSEWQRNCWCESGDRASR